MNNPTPTGDVVKVLRETIDRVETASGMFHNSQNWYSEDAPDGEGTLWDWIFAPAHAALATLQAAGPRQVKPSGDEVEAVARAIAPHLRVMVGPNPDCDDQHKAEEFARYVASLALASLRAPYTNKDALVEAVEQVLDDMGDDGTCCCEEAKANLRAALNKAGGRK